MPRIKLTKSTIDGLPKSGKDVVYWDRGCPGFGVKVTPAGRKVFIVLYRTSGSRLRKYTIGPYGRLTLHQAKIAAQRVFAAKLEGRDPAGEKRAAKRRAVTDRVDLVLEEFIAQHVSRNRSGGEIARILRREFGKPLCGKSLHEVTKRDVVDLASAIAQRGAPVAANKTLKSIKTFLSWCVGRAILERSPADGIPLPAKEVPRDRVLSDEELSAVLFAAHKIGGSYGAIVELLALTGQRREEVAQAAWNEFDLGQSTWTIPKSRTKNSKPHVVHMCRPVCDLLGRLEARGSQVFSQPSGKSFADFSRFKKQLDQLSGVTGWRLHDLRRTCVSGMARLGVAPHVADKVLNHQSGTISGVAAVYQRHDFLAERKDALERWGAHIRDLVGEVAERSFRPTSQIFVQLPANIVPATRTPTARMFSDPIAMS